MGDLIFSGTLNEINNKIDTWISGIKNINAELYADAVIHVKKEYSTFSWVIEGMLEQAGFKHQKLFEANNHITYLCTKK